MTDQSSLFSLETLPDTVAATSSPASVSGRTRVASPGSRTITHGGLDLVHANRSASAEGAAGPPIDGISGRTYFGSSVPDGPLASWESRLRSRLAGIGSTESALIWRAKVSPAGRSISRLAPSTRHTNGTDCTGSPWATTRVEAGRALGNIKHITGKRGAGNLEDQLAGTDPPGPTPSGSPATTEKRGAPNPVFAFWLMGFPDAWVSGALAAMQSRRSSRRKSSAPSSMPKKSPVAEEPRPVASLLYFDWETQSDSDLPVTGTLRYVLDPRALTVKK